MNSKKLIFLTFFLVCQWAISQVKIGENPNQINSASIVELESTSKAFVLTRVTTSQMLAIKPLRGALVYNTEDDCVFYYTGSTWVDLCNTNTTKGSFTFVDNNDGTFTVNYSDGSSFTSSDLTGPAGAQGPAGADGAVGPQGPQGIQGDPGPQGPAGADGAVGPQGPIGPVGPQGPAGLNGTDGADGVDGAVGPQGPAGADGADGAVGPQGPAGADGAVGPQGPQGIQGDPGPQGPAGADGAIGPQGPQGPQGDPATNITTNLSQ
ncbi:MAG: hypothetical protein WBN26_01050, partial [Muriicola sp.]